MTNYFFNTFFVRFRLPYPFVRASQTQAAVILRPTKGDFLKYVLHMITFSLDIRSHGNCCQGNIFSSKWIKIVFIVTWIKSPDFRFNDFFSAVGFIFI